MLTIELMPLLKLNNNIPTCCKGHLLVDRFGIPRFWATVWADVLKARSSPSTIRRNLYCLERLYAHSEATVGYGALDRSLANLEMDTIEVVLTSFLANLRNESAALGTDHNKTWDVAVNFISDLAHHIGTKDEKTFAKVRARLIRLDLLYGQLVPSHSKPAVQIRALPSAVVEELTLLFSPLSAHNPFRSETLKWRNFLIFLLMLQMGLRRGEIALLTVDAFQSGYDFNLNQEKYWLNVQQNPYEDNDPRFEEPGLKTAFSTRQLPIATELFLLARRYIESYRGKHRHSFLFVSQKDAPLSMRSIHHTLEIAESRLSANSREALRVRCLEGISPHDLRHTCAAFRLHQYVEVRNLPIDEATEKLRSFFGWAPESQMPRLYARAYFEPKDAEMWEENYSTVINALRAIEGMA